MAKRAIAIIGPVLRFKANPIEVGPEAAVDYIADGVVLMRGGRIDAVGAAADFAVEINAAAETHRYNSDHLILPGFVDTHIHYPQINMIASYGEQLIEWLERYAFPAEAALSDEDHAAMTAKFFLSEIFRRGTTTAAVYCTVHAQTVDAFFTEAAKYDARMIAGKVLMDRNAPSEVLDTAQQAYDESKTLIGRWHKNHRALYALTPRFAPTSTPDQLAATGALRAEYSDVYLQTHVSENRKEIAWVAELFPDCPDYLGVYEKYDLLGQRTILGHAIHLTEREKFVIAETQTAVAHCPTSNMFIGSGLFDLQAAWHSNPQLRVGLATDVGGGSSLSMLQTMKAAYEVAQLKGFSLDPVSAFYMATAGGADALGLSEKIGRLDPGLEADIIVLDKKSIPLIDHRMQYADSLGDELFIQMILGDDRAVRATYVNGNLVYDKDTGFAGVDEVICRAVIEPA